jgi:putative sterol carrier protein
VGNRLKPVSIPGFLEGLRLVFQPGRAAGLNAVYQFTFLGEERVEATVEIRDGTLDVQTGHRGKADFRLTADAETWLGFVTQERSLLWAMLRRKIRFSGPPRLLLAFGRRFPGRSGL